MSFLNEMKNFIRPYGEDEEYDDEYTEEMEEEYEAPAPQAAPRTTRREPDPIFTSASAMGGNTASFNTQSGAGFTTGQPMNAASNKIQMILVRPDTYNDAPIIAANMRAKKAVVLNLEGVEKNLARRVVDFLSGCAYALDGSVKKVSQSTYVFCPYNMEVLGDLKNLAGEVESQG